MLKEKFEAAIREVRDFPKPGINFKDITPLLSNPELCQAAVNEMLHPYRDQQVDAVVGVESRGFIFGMMLANQMNVPFVPIRKAGKLPYSTEKVSYDLEYGQAELEIHTDALKPGWQVMVHDDVLATGGTAQAAAQLISRLGANIAGYAFLIELTYLDGRSRLFNGQHHQVHTLLSY